MVELQAPDTWRKVQIPPEALAPRHMGTHLLGEWMGRAGPAPRPHCLSSEEECEGVSDTSLTFSGIKRILKFLSCFESFQINLVAYHSPSVPSTPHLPNPVPAFPPPCLLLSLVPPPGVPFPLPSLSKPLSVKTYAKPPSEGPSLSAHPVPKAEAVGMEKSREVRTGAEMGEGF